MCERRQVEFSSEKLCNLPRRWNAFECAKEKKRKKLKGRERKKSAKNSFFSTKAA
jgi:hypothetical protein